MKHISAEKDGVRRGKVFEGISYNMLELFFRDGFSFFVKLILARLILPEDFGLIGMAVVFTGLIQTLSELGLQDSLIQRRESAIDKIHYDTAFWSEIIISSVLFIIMASIVSPLASAFYNEPQLRWVIVILSIPVLLHPFILIQRVKMFRKLNFIHISVAGIISSLVSGVIAIMMALAGFGVWSLVFKGIVSIIVTIPILWKSEKWLPRLSYSTQAFKELFSFGFVVVLKNLTIFFVGNIDYLIVGRLLGSHYLGIYTLSFMLTDIFRSKFMNVLNKVMFPVYSKVQENTVLSGRYFLKVLKYNTIIIFPIMTFLITSAEPFLTLFFGSEWEGATLSLQLLALAVMFHTSAGSSASVLKGIGKVKLDFIIYLVKTFIITVPLIYVFTLNFGINGAAFGVLLSKIFSMLVSVLVMKRQASVEVRAILTAIFPGWIGSFSMLTIVSLLKMSMNFDNSYFSLILIGIIGLLSYIAVVSIFVKKEFIILTNQFRHYLSSK